jgi:hypothetical protein
MNVVRAVLWTNGMVMAFDERGEQVPDYQGRRQDVLPLLLRDYPDLKIEGMDWTADAWRFDAGPSGIRVEYTDNPDAETKVTP